MFHHNRETTDFSSTCECVNERYALIDVVVVDVALSGAVVVVAVVSVLVSCCCGRPTQTSLSRGHLGGMVSVLEFPPANAVVMGLSGSRAWNCEVYLQPVCSVLGAFAFSRAPSQKTPI